MTRALSMVLLMVFTLLAFTGCSSTAPLPQPASNINAPYRLMAGDIITLSITQRTDLSGEYTLGPDGALFIAGLEAISLEGSTLTEAQAQITKALSALYYPVSVNLRVKTFQGSESVVILGEVQQPGTYAIENTMTLVQLIGAASGTTRDADLRHIHVVRKDLDGSRYRINLNRFIAHGDHHQNITLQSGDVVVVPRRPLRWGVSALNEASTFIQLGILILVTLNQLNLN